MGPTETKGREEGKGRDVRETLVFQLSSPCHWVPLGEEGLQRLGGQGGGNDDDGGGDDDDGAYDDDDDVGDDHNGDDNDNAMRICMGMSSIF